MKATTTAALLAVIGKVVAQGIPEPDQPVTPALHDDFEHDIVCETSDASPYLHHVDQLIQCLKEENDNDICFNQNVGRDDKLKCGKTIREFSGKDGGAAFQMCKTKKVEGPDRCGRSSPGKVSCDQCDGYTTNHMAFFIETLKNKCKSDERAGGKVVFKEGGELRLYSMPGFV